MMFDQRAVTNSLMDKLAKKCRIQQKAEKPKETQRSVDALLDRLELIKQHI